MVALTKEEIATAVEAVSTFPGPVEPLPQPWIDLAFSEFNSEQRGRIMFEFGLFLLAGARAYYKDDEFMPSLSPGAVLASSGVAFLKSAVPEGDLCAR